MMTMSAVSSLLVSVWEVGGLCINVLGVAMPAALWGEWLVSVPMLTYITLVVVDPPRFNRMDYYFIGSTTANMIFGFVVNIPQAYGLASFWISLAVLSFGSFAFLPIYVSRDVDAGKKDDTGINYLRYAKRFELACILVSTYALIGMNYFLSLAGAISPEVTVVMFVILSYFAKGLFVAVSMDTNLEMNVRAEELELKEERRANEARRSFMK